MSFTVDANLLIYASDERSPYRSAARAALNDVTTSNDLVYLFWPVLMAYLRITTHPTIFGRPLTPADAASNVEQLLRFPHVQVVGERDSFWATYRHLADDAAVRGKLVPDAHLVALMIENGVRTIWTHDRDYRRFKGIRVHDPFE